MNPGPPDISMETTLRDGTPILIRPVEAGDKPLFLEGFAQLSGQSRYLRFMRPMRELLDKDLKFFTEIDYVHHMAWGALWKGPEGDRGVGVARYVRTAEDPTVAEAAVIVVDDFQDRGAGTLLLGALYWSAIQNGVETFIGHVLDENKSMLRIMRGLGTELSPEGYGVTLARIPVHDDPGVIPDTTAGNVIRRVIRELSSASGIQAG